ncbi:tubulin-tyrosine ligase family protein, putative [Ichthyophthirius multifiliis]|uniref:Tubulin-tyrosine ligase family protein, putative n=1 Tax=Ichthyophthirius multifiliis TaxID=5932 RepID=G0R2D3_ICHMU|nr:tubulin-tyrosine ligase family protein, putative [Ichthyophthirius multifiliis]EGR28369.1 tubulin-tyrosine ligase family protein, putative [Ichthyophthirius multifiliis]|eukprot:XP_004027714.1 tubulin-tyrosine ligase family protein, putative [Ichthyophthirius multifiliis]
MQDEYKHSGQTFRETEFSENTKKVVIRKGNTSNMILNYFKSRQDFEIIQFNTPYSDQYDFKWTDFSYQQNYLNFQENKQIINHIPNIRNLLSYKDSYVITLKLFDIQSQNIYKIKSKDFHFETYIFNLTNPQINQNEKFFFDNINSGYWLAKDPNGSLGIKLFKNVTEIKENIKYIKQNLVQLLIQAKTREQKQNLAMFQVIQRYLENPLLIDGKKNDIRSYILIPSINPFVVLYQNGFVRKCISNYTKEFTSFEGDEAYKHLTNRIFQKKHKQYETESNQLMITIEQFEQYLQQKMNISPLEISKMWNKCKKAALYSILSAKDKLGKKKGYFQLLGIDLIFDDKLNAFLIEFNTSAGLFMELQTHFKVIPQLVQSTLDIILESHDKNVDLWDYWRLPKFRQLGNWEVIYNEANEYNFLYESEKKDI